MTAQTEVRANGYLSPEELEIMYADGFPNLHETSPREINIIYPPKREPIPDGVQYGAVRFEMVRALKDALDMVDARGVALGHFNIYFINKYGRRESVAPDAFVALDASPRDLDGFESYFMELMGKPPEFALGVASQSTSRVDLEPNLETYAYIGVPEYWLIDFTGGIYYGFPLRGLKLVDGEYVQIDLDALSSGGLRGRSEVLGIDFEWTGSTLRLRDPATDNWIRTPMENVTSLAVEPTRAEIYLAQALADAEARADAAEAENAELRERLGQLQEAGRAEG